MKRLIQSMARARGLEILKLKRFGRIPNHDIQNLFKGHPLRTVFDVGANEGQTAIQFVNDFPSARIHCFEPCKTTYRTLHDLMSNEPRLTLINCALGDANETRQMWLNSASVTNSLLPNSPHANKFQPPGAATNKGVETVTISTLDAYCRKWDIDTIDLLKIDTQGYELRVLKGSERAISEGRIAVIFCEVLFSPLYDGQSDFHDIYCYLWDLGFRLVNLYNLNLNEEGYASWCDALFVQPEVMASLTGHLDLITGTTSNR